VRLILLYAASSLIFFTSGCGRGFSDTVSSFISFLFLTSIVVIVFAVVIYNKLQQHGQQVKAGHANVLTMIQKRADLVNKLMDIAREYGAHEKLTHITVSNNLVDTFQKTNEAITNVSALATQYPDLKANATYQKLMEQIHSIESDIQIKREAYNSAVRGYNSYRLQIPQVLIAPALGFKEAPYFDLENIQAIKEFRTDDGEMLKNAISQATSRAVDMAKKGIEKGMENMERAKSQNSKFCQKCGARNNVTAKFCESCGTPFE